MKRLTMTALLLLCGTAFAATPKAENVTISGAGSREVTITYTLTAAPVVVTLDIETNTASGAWVSIGGEHLQRVSGQGTTPRNLTDLIGSLCDLTSGSGDKGTPIIWISGYFDNLTAE